MDVNLMQNASLNRLATNAAGARAAYAAQSAAQSAESSAIGGAYAVEISDEAKQAQQAAKVAAPAKVEESDVAEVKTKGLDTDTVQSLKDSIKVSEHTMLNVMIQAMSSSNDKLQSWLDDGVGVLNFKGKQISAASFGLPEVATNPADAAKAISDGGAWSVDSVATRLFDLASAIAGDDPEKLAEMRSAVEEGFKQAGYEWENATGMNEMPDITKQTYNELMHRFDVRMQQLTGAMAS